MKIEQRIYNGDQAKQVLDNEAFKQAFTDIETEILESWKTSPARDLEGREKLWLSLQLLSKLKTTLVSAMDTGKLASLDLRHHQSISDRLNAVKSAIWRE